MARQAKRGLGRAPRPDAPIVWVPVAGERDACDAAELEKSFLKRARGVRFAGGRQWRLVDSYLGTRTEREFRGVVERGGVIGGSFAGAAIQGSYLVRGARTRPASASTNRPPLSSRATGSK